MSLAEAVNDRGASAHALYGKLEERILARDQKGASDVYYDLVRDGRPLTEIVARRCASTRPTPTCPITSASTTATSTSSTTTIAC